MDVSAVVTADRTASSITSLLPAHLNWLSGLVNQHYHFAASVLFISANNIWDEQDKRTEQGHAD